MSSLTYFTVTGRYLAPLVDSPYDVDNDPQPTALSGMVTFTPLINTGDSIPATTYTPPTNLLLVPITVPIRSGQITTNGVAGVRLPANTDVLGLDGDLYYRVDYGEGLLGGGKVYHLKPFDFIAPTTDTTVDLVTVTPLPGDPAVGEILPVLSVAGKTGTIQLYPTDIIGLGTDISDAIDALIAGAPGALDTLNELAAALGDDANFATTVTNALANKQPLDADLTAIAALTSAANKVPYATGAGTWALADLTAAGRALLDDADAAAQRTSLNAQALLPVGYYTPVGKPDGAITAFDSGQTVYTFGGSVGGVVDEEIVHTPTGVPSATYYEMDAGARVYRMGCEVKWPLNALGAATLVLPITPWGPPGGHPSGSTAAGSVAGIHLSVFGNGVWYQSRWNVGSQTIFADYTTHGRFPTIWGDGEFHSVEVWIDPEKGEGRLFVDGWASKVFSNVTIADDTGDWAVWEQFNTNGAGDVPCVIRNMWVDTQPRRPDTHVVTRADIADAVDAVSSDAYDVATVTTSGGSTTLTKDSATFQLLAGSASHTMVLPTTDITAGRLIIVQNASTGVITVNASGGGFVTALASGGTGYFISVAATPTTAGNWLALPLVTTTAIQSMTGKALIQAIMRGMSVVSAASASTLTPVVTTANLYVYTALAANLTIAAPSGTPADGHTFLFRITDDGTSRTLAWNATYRGVGVLLPAATVPGQTMYATVIYNAGAVAWDVIDIKVQGNPVQAAVETVNTQTGTGYTLVLADAGKVVTLNNAAAVTLTVPPNSSVAFPVGTTLDLAQLGAGQVTITPGAGVTLRSTGLKIAAQYGAAYLLKLATDEWIVTGLLTV